MRISAASDAKIMDGLAEAEIALLRLRAARYARQVEDHAHDIAEAVIFTRGDTRFAVPLAALREVRPLRGICRIPGSSGAAPGIFHFRGELLSLHDLAAFMDPADAGKPASWVLVTEHAAERIGLLGDEIGSIEQFSGARVRPVPITFGDRGACFEGVLEGVLDGGVLLLSPPRLFDTPAFHSAF